jgi:mono/diheme cytochrome c family protein
MKNLFVSLVLAMTFIGQGAAQKDVPVTPVTGESWLSHLHRALENTSMGKTVRLGPPTIVPTHAMAEQNAARLQNVVFEAAKPSLIVQGADLYRLNCQGCHGEFGLGAPPEINSVIEPTRATSASLIMARMKQRGLDTSWSQASEMANQAKGSLLDRLHKGGTDMPPFPHLSEPDVRAIFSYLRQLAGIPGAERQQVHVEESPLRVGEHIVKSTCHTCHNAAGVNPSPNELMQGVIPPLSTLTTRVTVQEFERKVRHGAPIMMGTPVLPYRGRMPVFDYLSESEVADAYLYLKLFPPSAWTDPATPPNPPQTASAIAAIVSTHEPPKNPPRSEAQDKKGSALPILAEVFVGLLVVGGTAFTLYDVKRSKAKRRPIQAVTSRRLATASPEGSPILVQSVGRSAAATQHRMSDDSHKQAAWQSRFDRTEYHVFESSWLSRRWENEDGVA